MVPNIQYRSSTIYLVPYIGTIDGTQYGTQYGTKCVNKSDTYFDTHCVDQSLRPDDGPGPFPGFPENADVVTLNRHHTQ